MSRVSFDRSRILAAISVPLAAGLLAVACSFGEGGAGEAAAPPAQTSAVLFIGDGMGPGYITAARVALGGSSGRLRLDDMPYTAVMRTHSEDSPVTDSAAAASAMGCGRKTASGVICQDESAIYAARDGKPLESIAIWAKKRGLRVGVITNTRVTHASPAAFYAIHNDRDQERDLARQAVASPLDILLGGGRATFLPEPHDVGGRLPDDVEDLEATARGRGWRVVTTADELFALTTPEEPVLGLFAESHLPYEIEMDRAPTAGRRAERTRTAPTLVEMVSWAIDRLVGSGDPFLLIVEGGRIDHAGHDNRARAAIVEMAALDEAVGIALDRLDPQTTLLLVTADHDTGGLTINGYPKEEAGIWGTYRTEWGPPETYSVLTFSTGPGLEDREASLPEESEDRRPSGTRLESAAHTALDVHLYAWGREAEQVHGTFENTAVYWLLRAHLEGEEPDRATLTRAPR
jgi:alkaline phosphatase